MKKKKKKYKDAKDTKNHGQVRRFWIRAFHFISSAFLFQLKCCLTFSQIELQMLIRCCLIHINIIIMRHSFIFITLLCLDLGLSMSYLCDQFFIFIFILMMINQVILWIHTHTHTSSFAYFRICPIIFGWSCK